MNIFIYYIKKRQYFYIKRLCENEMKQNKIAWNVIGREFATLTNIVYFLWRVVALETGTGSRKLIRWFANLRNERRSLKVETLTMRL